MSRLQPVIAKLLPPRSLSVFFSVSIPLLFLIGFLTLPATAEDRNLEERRVLRLGAWRTEDIRQMNLFLEAFKKEYPNIRIIYDPTPATEYDAVLTAQLKGGTAPDLFYLRSFGTSLKLHAAGYLTPLNDIPEIQSRFDKPRIAPWSAPSGVIYGVPFIATSHGIYYNVDLFKKNDIQIPKSWEAFLEICQILKKRNITPLANASGDPWTINEILLFNILPNFIGGRAGRMAYLNGERCFDDPGMIDALSAIRDLAPFLPDNHPLLKYGDSLQLFVQGHAAMWFGGSWDIPYFMDESPDFEWQVFAPPPPRGKAAFITFHLDAGIGVNAATPNKTAALTFIRWLTRPETGRLMAELLPGFFPMHREALTLSNPYADRFLSFSKERGTDIRFVWEKLRNGDPDGYTLTMEAAMAALMGTQNPKTAAESIQLGLSQWFEPARNCKE